MKDAGFTVLNIFYCRCPPHYISGGSECCVSSQLREGFILEHSVMTSLPISMAWPDQPGQTSETSLVLYSCPRLSSQGSDQGSRADSPAREQSRPGPDLGHYTDFIEARLKYRLASTYSPTVAKCQYHIFMANIWRLAESKVKQVARDPNPSCPACSAVEHLCRGNPGSGEAVPLYGTSE